MKNYEVMKNYLLNRGVKFNETGVVDVDTYYDYVVIPTMQATKKFIARSANELMGQGNNVDVDTAYVQSYIYLGIISQEESEADNALEIVEERLRASLQGKTINDLYPTLTDDQLAEALKYYDEYL